MNSVNKQLERLTIYARYGNRMPDIGIAVPMLFVMSPIILLVAIAVRIGLGIPIDHPILFRLFRAGLHTECFTLLKFRTMTDEKDLRGKLLPDIERKTNFGGLLRSCGLDNFPDLFYVSSRDTSLDWSHIALIGVSSSLFITRTGQMR